MADQDRIIDGFAHWIENEENGVCYIPLNLCKEIMELLKERDAQYIIGVLNKIRNELWEDSKQYLIKNTSEEKPILTDDEYHTYGAKTELVADMEKAIEIVRDYYKSEISNTRK